MYKRNFIFIICVVLLILTGTSIEAHSFISTPSIVLQHEKRISPDFSRIQVTPFSHTEPVSAATEISHRVLIREVVQFPAYQPDILSELNNTQATGSRSDGTCTVNTTADSGAGSFRQCLFDAVSGDTINFNTTVFPSGSPATIAVLSTLPYITSNDITIDASNAGVILDGSNLSSGSGLLIDGADEVTIRGLRIFNFPGTGIFLRYGASNNIIGGITAGARNIISGNGTGVAFISSGTSGNQVLGNYIGTDDTGSLPFGNYWGVIVAAGATNNLIGGNVSGGLNLISGNEVGVQFQDIGTSGNQILGNYIGTNANGTEQVGNVAGVVIGFGAQNNIVGGETSDVHNIISGNDDIGIVFQNAGTSYNLVLGNYIGTDVTGNNPLNNPTGIVVGSGVTNNTIGGNTPEARNVISGNNYGIFFGNASTSNNYVLGNYIGTNATGTEAVGNLQSGIVIDSVTNNFIGGDTFGSGNVISGNFQGISFENSASGNLIRGNYIGTDITGSTRLGNGVGVVIAFGAINNTIGGETTGSRNIISGNEGSGVQIEHTETTNNQIIGNYIGTDITGNLPLGNERGIVIGFGAQGNIIGGETSSARNIVSGNILAGIQVQNEGTGNNKLIGNYIGIDATGDDPLGNSTGVVIGFGASNNTIGGETPGTHNVISGNTVGVSIQNEDTSDNKVVGNYIGTDAIGNNPLGNFFGVVIGFGAQNNVVGGGAGGSRNIISGNIRGVVFQDDGTSDNSVIGNYIGVDFTGIVPLGNETGVVFSSGASDNLLGGEIAGTGNVISGNTIGLWIESYNTAGNQIVGNHIGTNSLNCPFLGNELEGIYLTDGASENTIGISNTISYNGSAGITISGTTTLENTITRNSIHHNDGDPINFTDAPVTISPPVFDTYVNGVLSGTVCASCRVEIFANPSSEPAGTIFIGETIADGIGNFSIGLTIPPNLRCLSATTTDLTGTTSEFSSSLCTDIAATPRLSDLLFWGNSTIYLPLIASPCSQP